MEPKKGTGSPADNLDLQLASEEEEMVVVGVVGSCLAGLRQDAIFR